MLTTAPHELSKDGPIFAAYRAVPWLSRSHAITMVPSAAALRTLRRLPPGSPQRQTLIAFGDPWFNDKQAAEAAAGGVQLAAAEVQTRGIPLKRRAGPQTRAPTARGLASCRACPTPPTSCARSRWRWRPTRRRRCISARRPTSNW